MVDTAADNDDDDNGDDDDDEEEEEGLRCLDMVARSRFLLVTERMDIIGASNSNSIVVVVLVMLRS